MDFLRALAVLPFISMSLKLRGFGWTKEWLRRRTPLFDAPSQPENSGEKVEAASRMAQSAARFYPRQATCLTESLALWWLLARKGIRAELRIGVRKMGNQFEAHAWIEHEGKALNQAEAPHKHYAAFSAALDNLPREEL
jgi:Transglutaminase-like superfamily